MCHYQHYQNWEIMDVIGKVCGKYLLQLTTIIFLMLPRPGHIKVHTYTQAYGWVSFQIIPVQNLHVAQVNTTWDGDMLSYLNST